MSDSGFMLPSVRNIHQTLLDHNIYPEGEISYGIKRHNDSATDGKSIFIKLLGESNSVEAFQRELAAARIFPFAPQPKISKIVTITADSEREPVPATLWNFIDGQEMDPKNVSVQNALELVDTLFNIYAFPVAKMTLPLSRINADAIQKRINQAPAHMPISLQNDIKKLINYIGVNIEELLARHFYTEVIAHGDPHLGNVLQLGDNTIKLIDYESIKITPIEFDLACMFQSLVQFHGNEHSYEIAKSNFNERKLELLGEPIDEKLLDLLISFRNISSTTYLISFGNWELINKRVQSLLPMLSGVSYPERIKLEVDWLE